MRRLARPEGLAPAVPGDFDGDGDVNGDDFLAWQRGLGTPQLQGSAANGDADGDRDVDAVDLAGWRSNYGAPLIAAAVIAGDEDEGDENLAFAATTRALKDAVLGDDEWILLDSPISRRSAPVVRHVRVDEVVTTLSPRRDAWRPASRQTLSPSSTHEAGPARLIDAVLDEDLAWLKAYRSLRHPLPQMSRPYGFRLQKSRPAP